MQTGDFGTACSRTPLGRTAVFLRSDGAIALLLALALTFIYSANGELLAVGDAIPNVYLVASLLDQGQVAFTPSRNPWLFAWKLRGTDKEIRLISLKTNVAGFDGRRLYAFGMLIPEPQYFLVPSVRSDPGTQERQYVGLYGVGASLTAVPVLAVVRTFVGDLHSNSEWLWYGAKFAASLLAAASASLIYLTCRRWLNFAPALFLALAYGLGTCLWSMSSQALWQHPPNEFFLAVGTFFFLRARGRADAALAGFSFTMATACRPTSAIFLAAVAGYLLFRNRQTLLAFVAGSLPVAFAIGTYNLYFLGSPFLSGQVTFAKAEWSTPLREGMAGLLVSPSRGLFVFSPFLVFSIAGGVTVWRKTNYAPMRPLTIAVILILVVHAKWLIWWGGRSFGYRIIGDLATTLVILMIPAMAWILTSTPRKMLFAVLVGWSVFVQAVGVIAYDNNGWHDRQAYRVALPSGETLTVKDRDAAQIAFEQGGKIVGEEEMNVDLPRWYSRLWSLKDNQIGYYLTHFGEARRAKAKIVQQWINGWRLPSKVHE